MAKPPFMASLTTMTASPADVLPSQGRIGTPVVPLCVDLDGTLVLSDLLFESLICLIKRRPFCLFLLPFWLLRGPAVLKAEISARVTVNPEALPYNYGLIQWLESERSSGRQLWLCTATHELIAHGIAAHLNLFDGVIASNRDTNLAGPMKAARLVEAFGKAGFDYCGNERRDIAIWKCARGAIVVYWTKGFLQEIARHAAICRAFPRSSNTLNAIIRALRPHQWTKNLLLFVPLLAAHRADNTSSLIAGLLATAAFCLCASSVYITNDLLDLEADRAHPRKSKRPFAAGDLSLLTGLALIPCLLTAALLVATLLPARFLHVLVTYYAFTLAYSFALKKLVLVDVLLLASLYTLRIIAGAAALSIAPSFWLLWFSMFLFLSLAFVKRFTELDALRRHHRMLAAGRGYTVEDLPILQSLGSAGGYLSVLVLALYINSPDIENLYGRPEVIWILCILVLYWISRVWLKAQRGEMHDDPVVFALRDPTSLSVFFIAAMAVILAI